MTEDRIAIVSDVHGNLTAYRAVLADLARRGIDRVINLGDIAGKGPRGSECIALTRDHCRTTVRGNWDAFLAETRPDRDVASQWWYDELNESDRSWLGALPNTCDLVVSGRRVRLFHASAVDEFTRVMFHHTEEQFAQMFAATPFTGPGPAPDVVGYGDIHDTYLEVDGGRTLFNAGSVGNALDEPTAAYAIISGVLDATEAEPFGIEFVRVPYDVEAEIMVARELGMPQLEPYARELRTATYRGRA